MLMRKAVTNATHWGRALAGLVLALGMVCATGAPAYAAEPARAIDAANVQGCCLCRGTAGAEQSALRACSDGQSPAQCVSACRSIDADSIIFGYQQTCSQGCAGYPTQGLQ